MQNKKIAKNRWFIWTIVFLVVAGVGLVAWMQLTDDGTGAFSYLNHHPFRVVNGRVIKK